jgi:hypothetical protein
MWQIFIQKLRKDSSSKIRGAGALSEHPKKATYQKKPVKTAAKK